MRAPIAPFSFSRWIDEHRELLRPPVCNKIVYTDFDDFIVMVVGGPNSRTDYHYNEGEELFYQVEGDMVLRTQQQGEVVDVPIRQGELFLLPPTMPHSPQRFEDTVGLVIERKRRPEEQDGFQWYCPSCNAKIYEEYLHLTNIETQLPPVFDRFYGSEAHRSCDGCGAVMPPRDAP